MLGGHAIMLRVQRDRKLVCSSMRSMGSKLGYQNYLVPIDAKAEGAEALDFEMVRVDRLSARGQMQR